MKRVKTLVLVTAVLALRTVMSLAQQVTPGAGMVGNIEGKVYLNEQRLEPSPTPVYVYRNSVVRTDDGRAEILLAGGVSMLLGENASFKFIPNDPYDFSQFEVLNGSAVLATGEIHSLVKCENEVTLSDSGLYRFDVIHLPGLNQKLCGFKVYEGAAAVQLASVISVLTRGKATTLSLACGDHVGLWTFDLEQADALDNWSRQQIRLRRAQ